MERKYKVSVAMATFNGEKYIKQQIDSILINLNENDEIVISDDGSTDNTINIISSYSDKRIRLINGPKNGIKKNFENAIKNSNGKYIFLADQDDIWMKNKVNLLLKKFEDNHCTLIVHDAEIVNDKNDQIIINSFFDYRKSGAGAIKNIVKNTYIGCCIAFDSKIKESILPIPNNIEMHDQWIGIINDLKYQKSVFVSEKLIKYRRHDSNFTKLKHHSFLKMLKNRLTLIIELKKRCL